MTNNKKRKTIYDLEERTAKFGKNIIDFVKGMPKNHITQNLISQLIRSATSVGANYCEADCAESKKDFEHKTGLCRKESKETSFWLKMIAKAIPNLTKEAQILRREATELNHIFSAIIISSKSNTLKPPSKNNGFDIGH